MYFQPTHRYWLLFILLIISIAGAFWERTTFNNGLGWDGKNYAFITKDFEPMLANKEISSYQFQRILTPAVTHYICKVLKIPITLESLPYIYRVFNLLFIGACVMMFFSLCTQFKLKPETEIIGFSGLFFNYFILKNTPYYPILTDVSAFLMGMLLCYFYFKRKSGGMLLTLLAGHFTYPLFLLSSLPLYLNIRTHAIISKMKPALFFKSMLISLMIGYIIILSLMLARPQWLLIPAYTMQLNTFLLPLSLLLILFYLSRAIQPFGKINYENAPFRASNFLVKIAVLSFYIWLCQFLVSKITTPEDVFTAKVFLMNIFQQSIANPLAPIISHLIYFGPALLLVIMFYKEFRTVLVKQGDSAVAYFFVMLLLTLGSESRQFIHFYPFLIAILMMSINSLTITKKQAILFCVLCLVSSKFWYPINVPGIYDQCDFGHFPDQGYFMNHGPFMSRLSYYINVGVVSVLSVLVFFLFRATRFKKEI